MGKKIISGRLDICVRVSGDKLLHFHTDRRWKQKTNNLVYLFSLEVLFCINTIVYLIV